MKHRYVKHVLLGYGLMCVVLFGIWLIGEWM